MNVDILDGAVFETLEPDVIRRYLAARGWKEIRQIPHEMAVYELSLGDGDPYRVWLPLDHKFSDYASAMCTAFKTLAESEKKSQLSMLDDLQTKAIGDVIRVGSEDPLDRAEHTLLLADGIALHEQARQMALAGAWSASCDKDKMPVYPQSARAEITKYMGNLRLAQTERGSFVVRLISPIDVQALDQRSLANIAPPIPFERRAVTELLRGLKALKDAATDASRRGTFYFSAFQDVVTEGVSANLCDAVAPSVVPNHWQPVRVAVTWCDVFAAPSRNVDTAIEFDPPLMRYIREAASEFRKRNPEEVTMVGVVTDLHWPTAESRGSRHVKIYGLVGGRPRYVRVELGDEDYELAVDAHKTKREVTVRGVLVQGPGLSSYYLDKPSDFLVPARLDDDQA